MINQGQYLRQIQKLSPLQIQTIKLVSMPIQELEQAVRKELEENPALDETSATTSDSPQDVSLDSIDTSSDISEYSFHRNPGFADQDSPFDRNLSVKESFTQNLMDQLGFKQLSQRQNDICTFLIGSIEPDGYLRRDAETLTDDLAFHNGMYVSAEELQECIGIIQEFEPAGIGARDLKECLLLQLRACRQTPEVVNASKVLRNSYEDFAQRRYSKIMSDNNLDEESLREVKKVISKLNPSPGAQIDDSYQDTASQVTPDFILIEEDGQLRYEMPRSSVPALKVNKNYEKMLSAPANTPEEKQAADFAKGKINSARLFIESVRQRNITLRKCMDSLIQLQKEYLVSGDEMDLHPMILEDVAKLAELDISTVSRVVNSKYIQTSFGIIPMRYLFSERMSTSDGSEVSAREIRRVLQDIVDSEDKHEPLTDEQLVEALTAKGYKIARRTVAKYRDLLGIPLARWRKEV